MNTELSDLSPILRTLADTDISRILESVYKPDHIYITHAQYGDGHLTAEVRWFTPECYRTNPTHLTRIQIVSYFGQAAYLLGALLARDGQLGTISEEQYTECIRDDKATFRRLHLEFCRFIRPQNTLSLSLQSARRISGEPAVRQIRGITVLPMLLEIEKGSCKGQSEALLLS
jgi:hypothetical protein